MRASNPSADVFLLAANTYLKTNQLPEAAGAYRRAKQKDSSLGNAELERQLANVELPTPAPEKKRLTEERVTVPLDELASAGTATLERSKLTFEDVGGMDKLKDEIRMKIIFPLTRPEIYKAY